jgi:hypothetical protein
MFGGLVFVATATTHYFVCTTNSAGGTGTIDNVSVREIPGYHATAPSDAARPNLRLDGNGKWYLDRDTTDDNLPITWPTVLSESQLGLELVTDGGGELGTFSPYAVVNGVVAISSDQAYTGSKSIKYTCNTGTSGIHFVSPLQVPANKAVVLSCYVYNPTGGIAQLQWLDGADGSWYSTVVTTKDSWTLLTAYRPAKATAWGVAIGNGTVESVNTKTFYADNISVREATGTNVIYTATGDYTTKDSGLILSGATDYKYPQRPSGDYGRIVMASDSRYDAKIIKYLDQKRGRAYQLGPELVSNGGFDSETGWTLSTGITISGGTLKFATTSNQNAEYNVGITSSKSYLIVFDLVSYTSGTPRLFLGQGIITDIPLPSQLGRRQMVLVAGSADQKLRIYGGGVGAGGTIVFDNVSVREVIIP